MASSDSVSPFEVALRSTHALLGCAAVLAIRSPSLVVIKLGVVDSPEQVQKLQLLTPNAIFVPCCRDGLLLRTMLAESLGLGQQALIDIGIFTHTICAPLKVPVGV